eukprot:3931957-Rhodomonas_salina.1
MLVFGKASEFAYTSEEWVLEEVVGFKVYQRYLFFLVGWQLQDCLYNCTWEPLEAVFQTFDYVLDTEIFLKTVLKG